MIERRRNEAVGFNHDGTGGTSGTVGTVGGTWARRAGVVAFRLVPRTWLLRLRARHLAGRGPAVERRWRARALGLARLRGIPQDAPFPVAGLDGIRMVPADSRITAYVYWLGIEGHEPGEPAWWAALARGHDHALELGANVGLYTLAGASAAPDVRYRAVEPNPTSVAVLRRNVTLNGLDNVEVVHAAATGAHGAATATLRFPAGDPYGASSGAFVARGEAPAGDRSVVVPAAGIADLVAGVDLLKLDIEGLELEVLRAVRPWVMTERPTIVVEVLPGATGLQRFLGEVVDEAGYACVVVDGGRPHRVEPGVVTGGRLMSDHGARDVTLITPERLAAVLPSTPPTMTGRSATRRQPLGPLPEHPLASVVMPLFDMEDFVGDALASVRGSGYRHWECIVVDDGSTDRSAEVVASVARADDRVRLVSKDNGGPLSCLGVGVAEARGDVVLLLDADDLVTPDRIESVVAAFRSRPDAGFAVHRLALADGGQRTVGLSPGARRLPEGDLSAVVLARGSGVPHLGVTSGFAFRTEALRAVLPAPMLPRRFPDEYLRRVGPLVTDVVAVDQVLGVRRLHPGSLTARRSHRLEHDLAAACADYRLLDQAFDCVARRWGPDAPTGNATDVLRLEWITARLGGDPDWRTRWQALRTAPGFAALPARDRRYWQLGRYLPRPAFRYLVQARAQSAGPRLVVSYLRMMTDRRLRPPTDRRASLRQVARLALGRH